MRGVSPARSAAVASTAANTCLVRRVSQASVCIYHPLSGPTHLASRLLLHTAPSGPSLSSPSSSVSQPHSYSLALANINIHAPSRYNELRTVIDQTADVVRATTLVAASRGQPVRLYHELHGHGSHKVLFITGWAGSCENWRFQTDFFGKHGDFEVCIYENRGSGFSSAPEKNYSMRDMAQDAVDLMDQLGWESAHVVGVSMGGMIAQELALLAPNRIQSLTLASTCASRGLPPIRHIPWLITAFAKILLGVEKVKNMMPFFLYSQRWLNAPAPPNSGYSSNLEYMLKFHGGRIDARPPQSFVSAIRQLCGIITFSISRQRLAGLREYFMRTRIPAMVIHGTEDALVHLRSAWSLATDLGARLVVFEGRGHALNHEDIDLFNRLLLRHFYSAILGSSSASLGNSPTVPSFHSIYEEAARRAGWWRAQHFGAMERRAKMMVDNLNSSMIGFREWLVSFFRTVQLSGPVIEWLPAATVAGASERKTKKRKRSSMKDASFLESKDFTGTLTAIVSDAKIGK
ncbi:hypothetical protein HDU82_006669 [Entophlyctis luteolus]|nr:hypothetical protein HDU82_006669 [Entophlyctis luteolus]